MSQPTTYEYVQERIYRPDRDDFKSLLRASPVMRSIIYVLVVAAALLSIVSGLFYSSMTIAYAAKVTFYLSFIAAMAVYMSRDREPEALSNISENAPNKKFMLRIGNEVEKFYGDARRSSFAANMLRPILLDAEKIKRHGLISATIGAGKTVLMKGLIEQQAILGGGGLAIDGKGTLEFAKEVYGLFKLLGREKDFIHINFLDMDATHTINPLHKGSALAIYEILIALLEGEENEWKAKQKEYMKNVIKLLVWRRDHEKLALDFSILAEYMTLEKLVSDALIYRDRAMEFAAIEDFVQFVSGTLQIEYRRFLVDDSSEFFALVNSQKVNNDLQGVYDASMSAQAWRGVITNLKSDYGRVFNTQTPDISMWEAVQRNKFIFVTLPTMASDTTPKELGRLILGLIKGVAAEKAEKSIEPEIPFLVLPDEIGSYIIDGFGRLMSKSRALGISIWPIFQSKSQIDAVGKIVGSESTEYREIMDVVGTHVIMKNINPAITEEYNKMLLQKKFIDRDYIEKRHHINAQIGAEDHFRVEKEDAIKHSEVVNMNNGEMIVIMDGQVHRAVAAAESALTTKGKKTTFEGKDMSKKIPLTQYLPKKEFFKHVNQYYKRSA